MRKMIVATHNKDKLNEIRQILDPAEWDLQGMSELGFHEEIPETGETFAENAAQKAAALAEHYPSSWIFADDSGLCVKALNNEPGVHSARFLGDASYPEKIRRLQEMLQDASPDPATWEASFRCAIALRNPGNGDMLIFEGSMDGRIHTEMRGDNGFGYDPAFYLPEKGVTAAELDADEKNAVSHRGEALRKMAEWLDKYVDTRT